MNTRRGPWLSGLIVALIGSVWMFVQVMLAVVPAVANTVFGVLDAPADSSSVVIPGQEGTR